MSNVVQSQRTVIKILRSLVNGAKAEGAEFIRVSDLDHAVSKVEQELLSGHTS